MAALQPRQPPLPSYDGRRQPNTEDRRRRRQQKTTYSAAACVQRRSAFRILRSAFTVFCVQLRSESCVQLRPAFSCVLRSGFCVLRSDDVSLVGKEHPLKWAKLLKRFCVWPLTFKVTFEFSNLSTIHPFRPGMGLTTLRRRCCSTLRSAFTAFCVQLRSDACVQLRSAFSCVLLSGSCVLRSAAFASGLEARLQK
eukprot:gene17539-biopygen2133